MVDLVKLKQELKVLTRRKALYKALKEELSLLGYWKNKTRGNPAQGYMIMKNKSCYI